MVLHLDSVLDSHLSLPAVSFGYDRLQPSNLTISILLIFYLRFSCYQKPKEVGSTINIPFKRLKTGQTAQRAGCLDFANFTPRHVGQP